MLDRRLRIAAIVLALVGVGIGTYLTYIHYAGINPVCSIAHGCIKVQTSEWSKVRGVPVALIGLVGYVMILGSLLFLPGDLGRGASAGLSLFGFMYSAYLTYRELFSIHAICQWCVMSAIILTLLAIVTTWRLLRSPTLGGDAPGPAGGPAEPSLP